MIISNCRLQTGDNSIINILYSWKFALLVPVSSSFLYFDTCVSLCFPNLAMRLQRGWKRLYSCHSLKLQRVRRMGTPSADIGLSHFITPGSLREAMLKKHRLDFTLHHNNVPSTKGQLWTGFFSFISRNSYAWFQLLRKELTWTKMCIYYRKLQEWPEAHGLGHICTVKRWRFSLPRTDFTVHQKRAGVIWVLQCTLVVPHIIFKTKRKNCQMSALQSNKCVLRQLI